MKFDESGDKLSPNRYLRRSIEYCRYARNGQKTWFHGTGRRKESIARVFLRAGSGKFTVNGRDR